MTGPRKPAERRAAAGLALAILAAGCGSGAARPTGPPPAALVPLSPAASLTAAGTAWATVPMGAPSGTEPVLAAIHTYWTRQPLGLRTPPGVATNGALVLAGPGRQALITGIRPSLDLGFSPVIATRDGGGTWSSLPPERGFAAVPDALAAAADDRLIALDQDQAVRAAASQQASWITLTTRKALAAAAAGRRCALGRLTAVAHTPAGSPLPAGDCGRAGTAGVFTRQGGTWQLADPALPAAADRIARGLRLARGGWHRRRRAERQPRRDRQRPRSRLARAAAASPRAGRRPGPARPRHHRPARRSRQHAHRLTTDRPSRPLDQDPGHQGPDPVRLLQRQLVPIGQRCPVDGA